MRIGVILERKSDFPFRADDLREMDSELFSHEEEDALLSGLRDAGHQVLRIGDGEKLLNRIGYWRNRCDLAFNLSVGYRGLDRKSHVPGVLEIARFPYIGSAPSVQSLTRHKHHAKLVVQAAGIPTAASVLWTGSGIEPRLDMIGYPAIVKPVAESSSVGITKDSLAHSAEEARAQAGRIVARFEQPALIETFIRGTEVEVPLLGPSGVRPLGVVGITLDGEVVRGDVHLSSDSVYKDGYGFQTRVSGIDEGVVMKAAETAAAVLGIRDYGRIDFRVGEDGTPFFLEAGTHPHIQPHSSFYVLARERGVRYEDMLEEIVSAAARRLNLQSSQNSMSMKYQGRR
jgi:D-alanine-D-alanine ligase